MAKVEFEFTFEQKELLFLSHTTKTMIYMGNKKLNSVAEKVDRCLGNAISGETVTIKFTKDELECLAHTFGFLRAFKVNGAGGEECRYLADLFESNFLRLYIPSICPEPSENAPESESIANMGDYGQDAASANHITVPFLERSAAIS